MTPRSKGFRLKNHGQPVQRRGFTLLELLVVVLIVTLLSAATLPAILPALNSRRVSEGSRVLQSEFARARDAAVRSNSPRGFRLFPDPNPDVFPAGATDPLTGGTVPAGGLRSRRLTASRIVSLEVPPDYSEGKLYLGHGTPVGPILGYDWTTFPNNPRLPYGPVPNNTWPTVRTTPNVCDTYLRVVEAKRDSAAPVLPANPTGWYWNLRQGDKLRMSDSGQYYTVVGPLVISGPENPERFVNAGYPGSEAFPTGPGNANAEVLFLLNGNDDDNDGFVDEQFDGIDNDADGIVDPGFNGIDDNGDGQVDEIRECYLHRNGPTSFVYPGYDTPLAAIPYPNEFELETFVGKVTPPPPQTLPVVPPTAIGYSVQRRPVPTATSREVALPTNVVIDLTGSLSPNFGSPNPLSERSRVPIDPKTGYVDILVAPNGQILASAAGTNLAPAVDFPFYHFWFCERDDVFEPTLYTGFPFTVPMTRDAAGDPRIGTASYPTAAPTLKGERRLLSVNTRTGQITSTAVEIFYVNNTSYPFEAAEAGVKDAQP